MKRNPGWSVLMVAVALSGCGQKHGASATTGGPTADLPSTTDAAPIADEQLIAQFLAQLRTVPRDRCKRSRGLWKLLEDSEQGVIVRRAGKQRCSGSPADRSSLLISSTVAPANTGVAQV